LFVGDDPKKGEKKRRRKEKTDRDPDLQVSGHGHRSQVTVTGEVKNTGQVRSQVRGSRKNTGVRR
jgi:protein involved in polysaccharide export with SLBB domain